ncbi:MAG TPA: hypothetical protein VHA09_07420, partial [Nitrososphaera sp.]|nr:hypothetical protein [Nitrososphaera sp.]
QGGGQSHVGPAYAPGDDGHDRIFFVGYLYKAIHNERELRPLSTLWGERQSVVPSGFNAKTHFDVVRPPRIR